VTYEIEKGVEMPAQMQSRYPFAAMEPGDSFLIPARGGAAQEALVRRRVSAAASDFRRRSGKQWKFESSVTLDGVRVWRTE